MQSKKITAFVLVFSILLFAFSACSNKNREEKETTLPVTSAVLTTEPVFSSEAPESTSETAEETTVDNFSFELEKATLIGKFTTEIYGVFDVYFQDNHLALMDSYGTVMFTFAAEGLSPVKYDKDNENQAVEGVDMNFDGYTDLKIRYNKASNNSYYLCWMWNMTSKSFVYYEPLTSIPSPGFYSSTKQVISVNKTSNLSVTQTVYQWQDGELNPVSHEVISVENETLPSSDAVDSSAAIVDGKTVSYITLNCAANSNSRWICKIEDESIVSLLGDSYNESSLSHTFSFYGKSAGTTTVVFRYSLSWASDYVSEAIFNITVNPDKTLKIVEIS